MQDEISLGDIFGRLWMRRGLLAGLLGLALIAGAATALQWLASRGGGAVLYYIDLQGVEKRQYPGGAAFSPNDLQSKEVLRAALDSLELKRTPAQFAKIASALLVEYGDPATEGVIQKYRRRISSAQLSPAEIDAINEEFKDELTSTASGSLRLMLDPAVAELRPDQTSRLIQEIPAQWSRIYSERYRIFEDPGLESSALWEAVPALDRPAAIIAATAALKTLRKGLLIMLKDNRVNYLVTSSGSSAAELLERLERFESIRFRPLSEAVMTKRDPVADSYRAELRRQVQFLKIQIASYDHIADDMGGLGEGEAAREDPVSRPGPANQLQFSGDALRQIIGLAEQASSSTFLREVLLSRHELVTQIAEVEAELAQLEVPSEFAPSPGFAQGVESKLHELLADYASLHSVARESLRADLGALYTALSTPFQTGGVSSRQVVTSVSAVMLGVLFLGLLVVLLLPGPETKASLHPAASGRRVAERAS